MGFNHNAVRDKIAADYHNLPALTCRLCDGEAALPPCDSVTIERSIVIGDARMRVDIAALNATGEPVAVIEVIDTHPPRDEVLQAQKRLPVAFYVKPDALQNNGFSGWCSSGCWEYENLPEEERVCHMTFGECEGRDCGKPLYYGRAGTDPAYDDMLWGKDGFRDWGDDPHHVYCLHCAARMGYRKWNTPYPSLEEDGSLPPIPVDPEPIFLEWSKAAFRHMVWNERTIRKLKRSYEAETKTAERLVEVNNAFDCGDWGRGKKLLLPIGDRMFQEEGEALWAREPDNCIGVARAWDRLRLYLLNALPPDVAELIPEPIQDELLADEPLANEVVSVVDEPASEPVRDSSWEETARAFARLSQRLAESKKANRNMVDYSALTTKSEFQAEYVRLYKAGLWLDHASERSALIKQALAHGCRFNSARAEFLDGSEPRRQPRQVTRYELPCAPIRVSDWGKRVSR